jgi:hypothetical protein
LSEGGHRPLAAARRAKTNRAKTNNGRRKVITLRHLLSDVCRPAGIRWLPSAPWRRGRRPSCSP